MSKHNSRLHEFFLHKLDEAPLDPTFQPAPAVKASDSIDADPAAQPSMGDPAMTQDVAAMSNSSLSFFQKNVQSAMSKYGLEQSGFNGEALAQFATALDQLVFQMYQGVQDPASRQKFEADYQKLAADWSIDLTKLFDKVLKLQAHGQPY